MTSFIERRATLRFSLRLPVLVRWSIRDHVMEVRTRTHDLSGKSVRFSISQELKIGSPVELILTLNGRDARQGHLRVSCAGQVIRCSQWQSTPTDIVVGLESFRFIGDELEADEFEIRRKSFFCL